ncbi:MAG: AAA family ATPase [Actinobacteria bacterium]|nr:AAA family ATPase [Actinomycetota bacterium]
MSLCDICKIREANVTHTRIINGRQEVRHLCEVCAREAGITIDNFFGDFGFKDLDSFFRGFLGSQPREYSKSTNILNYLSDAANKALESAKESCVELKHDYLSTEHLLVGLMRNQNLASEIVKELGRIPEEIEQKVLNKMKPGDAESIREVTLTPRAKKALEIAFEVSHSMGSELISPEHILIGILAEGESLAARVLNESGITLQAVEELLFKISGKKADSIKLATNTPTLDQFSRDLTSLAREGKLDPVIGRELEIDRVIRILSRRTKNNPVLIGEPGVGKTAIVEGIAQRIVEGKVPEILLNKRLVQLDLAAVLAGTKYRGEFEERMKKIIDEIVENSDKIVLFIDELHTLVGAGAAEGAIDAGNMLKPYLARGDLHVIGATTLKEYKKYIEKDPALERRFQPVIISEPTQEEAIQILRGLRDRFEAHHRVKITDEAIASAVYLSDRYIQDRYLPDKAIDLLDEACSKVRLRTMAQPRNLKELEDEIRRLEEEKDAAVRAQEFEKAAELRDEIKKKRETLEKLKEEWIDSQGSSFGVVTSNDIAEVVSEATGIPVKKLVQEEIQKYLKMEEALHNRVVGQEEAIRAVSEAVRRAMAGLKDPNRPIGSFLFLGPTGVGKTELARALAEFLFGDEDALIRLDMSEYMEKHAVSRMIGSPPGYVGYEEGGQLTEAVRRRPYSVILLDEIEKAHPDVFNVLLQILDDGRLTDAQGRTVDFKNTIVIMTSNIGSQFIQEYAKIENKDPSAYDRMKEQVLNTVKSYFKPELLNRIDEIVVFHSLTQENLKEIVDLLLEKVRRKLRGQGIELEVSEEAKQALVDEGYDPQYGARPLRRVIQRRIENEISKMLLGKEFEEGDTIIVTYENGRFKFSKKGKEGRKKRSSKK